MSAAFQSGCLLYQVDRYEEAIREFRRHLAEDPNDAQGHAWLGLCLAEVDQFDAATLEAKAAIELDPTDDFAYYVLARIFLGRNRLAEARRAANEAIRLAPENASYHGLLAVVEQHEGRWSSALAAANQGLSFDPEHALCLNVRSTALTHLGRRDEAAQTIQEALAHDPENPWTHANHGWALLHGGKTKEALEHFREALRLDPNNELARGGIVEALKARNFMYRGMLAFFLWMTRLPPQWRWGVIIAIFFAPRFLEGIGNQHPDWKWATDLTTQLVLVFVVMTWIASPLFNLALRVDRFGRYALSTDQRRGANLLAVFLFPALGLWIASWFVTGPYKDSLFYSAWAIGVLVLPASTLYSCDRGWPRITMTVYLAVLTLMALGVAMAAIVIGYAEANGLEENTPPILLLLTLPVWMAKPVFYSPLATFFLANWLVSAKVKR